MRIFTDVELANDLIERAAEAEAVLREQEAEAEARRDPGRPLPPPAWISGVGVV